MDPALASSVSEYETLIAEEGSILEHSSALRFAERFRSGGLANDVLFAELFELPNELDNTHAALWLASLAKAIEYLAGRRSAVLRAPNLQHLGFDLCHPHGNHSAIFQPGLSGMAPGLRSALNEACLFDSIDSARYYLPQANALDYGALPFCIVKVWRVIA
jgi:hypothetical protein